MLYGCNMCKMWELGKNECKPIEASSHTQWLVGLLSFCAFAVQALVKLKGFFKRTLKISAWCVAYIAVKVCATFAKGNENLAILINKGTTNKRSPEKHDAE